MSGLLILAAMATVAADKEKATSEAPPNAKAVAGEYYRGDGLGMNITLSLKEDGKYSAEWHGCLGKYGEGAGTWSLKGKSIAFTPSVEKDMLKGYLTKLDTAKFKGEWILVPTDKMSSDWYEREGPSRFSCYIKKEKVK